MTYDGLYLSLEIFTKTQSFVTGVIYCQFYSIYRQYDVWDSSWLISGGRLNKKDGLTRYGDSHVKDKTS